MSQTSLHFNLRGNAYRHMIAWQQRIDQEVLRYQIETRGQALVTRLRDEIGVQKISTIPELGEAEPYYGAFGGAYRYTFHPLSGPQTGPFSAEQSAPLTGPLPTGCELEVYNLMGGFAFFYPNRIDPLRLFLPNPPELTHYLNDSNPPQNDPTPELIIKDGQASELRFRVSASIYAALTQWGWYGRSLSVYDFIFIPTTSTCLVSVRMRERGVVLELVKEGTL